MITNKKLLSGGDKAVEDMLNMSALLGIELIELVWTPRNGKPRFSEAKVIGPKKPVVNQNWVMGDDIDSNQIEWIDSTLTFYPDGKGMCWGYIFDCPSNHEMLTTSLSNGWFKIVDKKIKDSVTQDAIKSGKAILPKTIEEVKIKTKREEVLDDKNKTLEEEMAVLKTQKRALEEKMKELEAVNTFQTDSISKNTAGVDIQEKIVPKNRIVMSGGAK